MKLLVALNLVHSAQATALEDTRVSSWLRQPQPLAFPSAFPAVACPGLCTSPASSSLLGIPGLPSSSPLGLLQHCLLGNGPLSQQQNSQP